MRTGNAEAEQGIIGAILRDEESLALVMKELQPNDMTANSHQMIYQTIIKLMTDGEKVDFTSVVIELQTPELKAYLQEILTTPCSFKALQFYIKRVKKASTTNKLVSIASQIMGLANDEEPDIAIEKAMQLLTQLESKDSSNSPKHISSVLDELTEQLVYRDNLGDKMDGLPTGFKSIDERLQGIKDTDLVVIAASPSMGKSTYALNIAENAAYRLNKPSLIFSMEMSATQLSEKILSSIGDVELSEIRSGDIVSNKRGSQFFSTCQKLRDRPLYIDESPALTIAGIRSKAFQMHRETGGLAMIMVDYIGLMQDPTAGNDTNLKITRITGGLKALAKELKCPVIALSQLNREVAKRQDKRPVMSDLRDSGSVEQDADIIQFLYRSDYYENNENKHNGITEVITGKFRMGERGIDYLNFEGKYSRFVQLNYIPDEGYDKPFEQGNKPKPMKF